MRRTGPCPHLALLEAVRSLRTDLRVLAESEETRAVDEELTAVEDEIVRTGRAGRGRLTRLRDRLEGATPVTLPASASAVAQAVARVPG